MKELSEIILNLSFSIESLRTEPDGKDKEKRIARLKDNIDLVESILNKALKELSESEIRVSDRFN